MWLQSSIDCGDEGSCFDNVINSRLSSFNDIMKETEDVVDVAVLAERRAKLAKLRGEHFVAGRDITSAPTVTNVDEFEQKFGAADWTKSKPTAGIHNDGTSHKIFYAEKNNKGIGRKTSDFEFNPLVNEASRRGRHNSRNKDEFNMWEENGDEDTERSFGLSVNEEPYIDNSASQTTQGNQHINYSSSVQNKNKLNNEEEKLSHSLREFGHKTRENEVVGVQNEKSTKIYQDGHYVPSSEDLGYHSSISSPNESKKSYSDRPEQLLSVEKAMGDPLTMSLPETFLKSVQKDLSASLKSNGSTRSKVVYDPRMFGGQTKIGPSKTKDPERDYFEKMSNFHNRKRKSSEQVKTFV